MPYMDITTKIACRNACVYCPQDAIVNAYYKRSDTDQMTFDTFKKCVDKIPINVRIVFSGFCEPWLNPDCTMMLLYAHERGHNILVYTTLIGMKLADISLLEKVPFESFRVHLPSDGTHEKMPVDDNYLEVLDETIASDINARFHIHGEKLKPEVKVLMKNKKIKAKKLPT